MTTAESAGAINALLDEYKKAIDGLIAVIAPLSYKQLSVVVDSTTKNPDCRSIQTILTHVISSGYSYSIYIENHTGLDTIRPHKEIYDDVIRYSDALRLMFEYCENLFEKNTNIGIEETDNSKKINTAWGQQYDVEQLLEHAIVHILRHRRQVEYFIKNQIDCTNKSDGKEELIL